MPWYHIMVLYIGVTGQRQGDRFREYSTDVKKKTVKSTIIEKLEQSLSYKPQFEVVKTVHKKLRTNKHYEQKPSLRH